MRIMDHRRAMCGILLPPDISVFHHELFQPCGIVGDQLELQGSRHFEHDLHILCANVCPVVGVQIHEALMQFLVP